MAVETPRLVVCNRCGYEWYSRADNPHCSDPNDQCGRTYDVTVYDEITPDSEADSPEDVQSQENDTQNVENDDVDTNEQQDKQSEHEQGLDGSDESVEQSDQNDPKDDTRTNHGSGGDHTQTDNGQKEKPTDESEMVTKQEYEQFHGKEPRQDNSETSEKTETNSGVDVSRSEQDDETEIRGSEGRGAGLPIPSLTNRQIAIIGVIVMSVVIIIMYNKRKNDSPDPQNTEMRQDERMDEPDFSEEPKDEPEPEPETTEELTEAQKEFADLADRDNRVKSRDEVELYG